MEVISFKLLHPLLTTKKGKMNIHHLRLSFPRPLFLTLLISLTFSSVECMLNSALKRSEAVHRVLIIP